MKSVTEQWLILPVMLLASVFSQQVLSYLFWCAMQTVPAVWLLYALSVCACGNVYDVWLRRCDHP